MKPTQAIMVDTLTSKKHKTMYFVRFVESLDGQDSSHIMVMNEHIFLSQQYNHQFVFVEWDLDKERLSIYSEYQGTRTKVHELVFTLNA